MGQQTNNTENTPNDAFDHTIRAICERNSGGGSCSYPNCGHSPAVEYVGFVVSTFLSALQPEEAKHRSLESLAREIDLIAKG